MRLLCLSSSDSDNVCSIRTARNGSCLALLSEEQFTPRWYHQFINNRAEPVLALVSEESLLAMVLRAFPTPYRIGSDICFIPRIRRLLTSHHRTSNSTRDVPFLGISSLNDRTNKCLEAMSKELNPHFLAKLFRPEEIAALSGFYQRVASTMAHDRLYEHIAGRWAAKEAIIKASSRSFQNEDGSYGGKRTFHDIYIWNSSIGIEAAILSGRVRINENLDHHGATAELDGDMVEISISHDSDYAIATALFCDPQPRLKRPQSEPSNTNHCIDGDPMQAVR